MWIIYKHKKILFICQQNSKQLIRKSNLLPICGLSYQDLIKFISKVLNFLLNILNNLGWTNKNFVILEFTYLFTLAWDSSEFSQTNYQFEKLLTDKPRPKSFSIRKRLSLDNFFQFWFHILLLILVITVTVTVYTVVTCNLYWNCSLPKFKNKNE